MKQHKSGLAVLTALFMSVSSMAAQAADLDVTMEVVSSPDDLPEAVTKTLTLPPAARQNRAVAEERSAFGLETANAARNKAKKNAKALGQSIAEQAKQRGLAKGKGKGKGKGKP